MISMRSEQERPSITGDSVILGLFVCNLTVIIKIPDFKLFIDLNIVSIENKTFNVAQ